jgi:cell division protein FtsB
MSGTPRNNRPGSGPGRRRSRARAGAKPAPLRTTSPGQPAQDDAGAQRSGFTRRAVALIVVVLMLLLSYASSLRIWITTEQEMAANRAAIQQSQERIDELNGELARWEDPDYVRAQARERLGWVMPGETGYRVLGPDGQAIGTRLDPLGEDPGAPVPQQWWQRMWHSIEAADKPAPSPGAPGSTPSPKPPLTDGTHTPTPSPTPSATPKASTSDHSTATSSNRGVPR